MEGILAIVMCFGMPICIVGIYQYFKFRTLQLKLKAPNDSVDQKRLEAWEKDRALLEERVQNLETIVCSMDLDLQDRFHRLASTSAPKAMPLPAQGPIAKLDKPNTEQTEQAAIEKTAAEVRALADASHHRSEP